MSPFLRRLRRARGLPVASAAVCVASGLALAAALGTGSNDFFQPGTQPSTLIAPIESKDSCSACHGFFDYDTEPLSRWAASMMAQALRDPIFHACLTIAEQDAPKSGDLCIRCHSPGGWLEGRSTPTARRASPSFNLQPGTSGTLAGIHAAHAAVILSPATLAVMGATNPAKLDLVP